MSTVLTIESRMAGLVIGRGGSTIKNIQWESGATVKLVDGDSTDTKKVTITGNKDAQVLAASLVQKVAGQILHAEESAVARPQPKPQSPKGHQQRQREVSSPKEQQQRRRQSKRENSPPETITLTDEQWDEITRENEERERQLLQSLPSIKKDIYVEHEHIKAMCIEEVEDFRLANNSIMVNYVQEPDTSQPIPKPILTFEHAFHAYPEIMKVIKKQKFEKPSPVQCQAWPIIMSGHDLIAIAQTGTGKTLAYILPGLIHLKQQSTPCKERIGPTVLILGPTRELVIQIEEEIKKYTFDEIDVVSVYGGVSGQAQIECLRNKKPEIVVATPGRLNDLIGQMALKVDHVSYLVLDEADRMLDMGFKTQIELSLRHVRPDKQTILTSATWPIGVQQLANYFTSKPLHVTIGSFDLTTVNTVKQEVIVLGENQKEAWIENFIQNKMFKNDKVIIFMRKKISVDKLFMKLRAKNIECRCIHGGREQVDREESLNDLRRGVVSILIATDVASRGIDIHDISLVINYDFPKHIEEYVHRVGRTGRANKRGAAITLFSYNDKSSAEPLIDLLKNSKQHVPKELLAMVSK